MNNNIFYNNINNNIDNDWDEEPTQVHHVEPINDRVLWERIDDFDNDSHDCYFHDHEVQCDNINSTTTRIVNTKELINTCIAINISLPATTEEYLEFLSMLSESDKNYYQQFTKSQNLENRDFKLKLKTAYEAKFDSARRNIVSPSFYIRDYKYDHNSDDSNCSCTESHHCVFTKNGKSKLYLPKQSPW